MIVVTGGAGFIGSRIVKKLNQEGYTNIIVVDDLTDGSKFTNIVDCRIVDYIDKQDFLNQILKNEITYSISSFFHQGACSVTMELNGHYMMKNNFDYSKHLLHYAINKKIPFIYASSASVYGNNVISTMEQQYERPLNIYGYSKLLFDNYVRRLLATTENQIVGLRYFNVYGSGETHKGDMASVVFHWNQQIVKTGVIKVFEGCDGYDHGEQSRDFIYVDDVVNVNIWFFKHTDQKGIYNVGTGKSRSFNEVARTVLNFHQQGSIQYIPFPQHLYKHYQKFTQADLTTLRRTGYSLPFTMIEEGISKYLKELNKISADALT